MRARLKSIWSDGTFTKLFQPQDLIAKGIALLPAPHTNLVRFHGQFTPNTRWRVHITRAASTRRTQPAASQVEEQRQRRMAWSVLLRRSFAVNALTCPACGGRRELLAVIEHKPTVQKILTYLGLAELALFAAPRGPPLPAELKESATNEPIAPHTIAESRGVADLDFAEPDAG